MEASGSARSRLAAPQRKGCILAAAEACFARDGFRGTRTRDIARACGVSEAILFRHFPTKRRLYAAILARRLADDAAIFPPYGRFASDAEFFAAMARGMLRRMSSDPLFMRILLYSALEESALARGFYAKRIRRTVGYLAGYIARRRRQGAFRTVHPEAAARAFLGMAVHYALVTRLFRAAPPKGVAEEDLPAVWADLFLKGIRGGRNAQ